MALVSHASDPTMEVRHDGDVPDIPLSESPKTGDSTTHHLSGHGNNGATPGPARPSEYRVYKRRFFGLLQLVLLNIVVNWDVWLALPSPATLSRMFTDKVRSGSTVAFLFRCVDYDCNVFWRVGNRRQLVEHRILFRILRCDPVSACFDILGNEGHALKDCIHVASVVVYTLNHGGPRQAMMVTSALALVGNWLRYAGSRVNGGIFGLVMFGQILIGLAQPFCLTAPTRYSDLWFSHRGRTSATAVATLANPFGAALGQLVNSMWVSQPGDVPNMVLYVSIIVRHQESRPISLASNSGLTIL
jgi:hypothetical protein